LTIYPESCMWMQLDFCVNNACASDVLEKKDEVN